LTVAVVREVLVASPGLDKHQLLQALQRVGLDVATTSDLNSFLYGHRHDFAWSEVGTRRIWTATSAPPQLPLAFAATPDGRTIWAPPNRELELYPWQRRALRAWQSAARRGVVEAVTGAGKTRLALQAMLDALVARNKVAVIVPTLDLVRQWYREIQIHVAARVGGPLTIGLLAGGERTSLVSCDVLLSTASSASQFQMLLGEGPALLIADECHHYGAEVWSRGLEEAFRARLGLTATYERNDNGVEEWLDPYFGGRCYHIGYKEALDDGVIAPFRIAFVGVRFSPEEARAYEDAATKAGRYRSRLVREWGLPAEPFGEFMRAVQKLRAAEVPDGSKLAGFYLSAFAKRRKLMAESHSKLAAVATLSPAVRAAGRTIVFAQTVAAADSAISCLEADGHAGAVIESSMDAEHRRDAFTAFERGDYKVVAAPKLLDEGVDVPAADLGIVLATSRSRRQLIQRMGRIIRRKRDGRSARLVILFVEGTAEDPDEGAHEDFLEEVLDVAEAVKVFRAGSRTSSLLAFLAPRSN
jgi:RNA polymerase primary sigma factor